MDIMLWEISEYEYGEANTEQVKLSIQGLHHDFSTEQPSDDWKRHMEWRKEKIDPLVPQPSLTYPEHKPCSGHTYETTEESLFQ